MTLPTEIYTEKYKYLLPREYVLLRIQQVTEHTLTVDETFITNLISIELATAMIEAIEHPCRSKPSNIRSGKNIVEGSGAIADTDYQQKRSRREQHDPRALRTVIDAVDRRKYFFGRHSRLQYGDQITLRSLQYTTIDFDVESNLYPYTNKIL